MMSVSHPSPSEVFLCSFVINWSPFCHYVIFWNFTSGSIQCFLCFCPCSFTQRNYFGIYPLKAVAIIPSFWLLNCIPLLRCTTFCFLVQVLLSIWVDSNVKLLHIKLLINITYKSLYEHILSFLLGKYLAGKWLDLMVGESLTF